MMPYGGSKQSGYIQRLIMENPALFELGRVRNPSANLQTRFAVKEAPKRRKLKIAKEEEKPKALTKEDVNKAREDYKKKEEEIKEPLRKFAQRIEKGYKNKPDDVRIADYVPIVGIFKQIKMLYVDAAEKAEYEQLIAERKAREAELNEYRQRFYRTQSEYSKEKPKVEEKKEEEKPIVKRKLKIAKEEEKKEEEKPIVKRKPKAEEKSRVNEQRNEFFKLLIQFLSSKSTRDYNKFKKEHPEFADKIENIVSAQKGLDFYPTPVECLKGLEDIIRDKNTTSILEPTAGLGNIVNWIEENKNPKAEVMAIEFNRQFIQPLKELFPDVNVREGDFLEYKPATNDFDCIVCNPPFNLVGRKNAYIDFLFKCLHLLNTSSKAGTVFCIFICPTLTNGKHDDGDLFEFREVLEKAKYPVVKRALETITGKTITKAEFKSYVEDGEDNEALELIEPFESQIVKRECKGFGGTGAQPAVYLFKIINYRRGGRKRRC